MHKPMTNILKRSVVTALMAVFSGSLYAADKTIDIGVSDALTGPGAVYGLPQSNAVKMAVEEINAKGGVKAGADTYKFNVYRLR